MKNLRLYPTYFLFFAVLFLTSCSVFSTSDSSDELNLIPASATPVAVQSVLIDVEQLSPSEIGSYDYAERTLVLADDEASFTELWEKLHSSQIPVPDPPTVNFEESLVVAAMMGVQNSGGYSIEIVEAAIDEERLWIRTEETEPGENCATTDVITSPYHIVKLDRNLAGNKQLQLVYNRKSFTCD
ncbi:MAG: protease complex subunit PrcB family protein [Balneolaceae bacterium]|nr:protease complex subunit PrcB family protein [Balneolaceae bacterium]